MHYQKTGRLFHVKRNREEVTCWEQKIQEEQKLESLPLQEDNGEKFRKVEKKTVLMNYLLLKPSLIAENNYKKP